MLQDTTMVTTEWEIANRKPYPSFRMVSFSMTLSDLEWLIEIFNDMQHARSVCDSWASCFITEQRYKKTMTLSSRNFNNRRSVALGSSPGGSTLRVSRFTVHLKLDAVRCHDTRPMWDRRQNRVWQVATLMTHYRRVYSLLPTANWVFLSLGWLSTCIGDIAKRSQVSH